MDTAVGLEQVSLFLWVALVALHFQTIISLSLTGASVESWLLKRVDKSYLSAIVL